MSPGQSVFEVIYAGLWRNNQALVAMLGMCSLLAITTNAINGLGMGIAATVVLTASNGAVALTRHMILPAIRIPIFVVMIASFVTALELSMKAWFYDLYQVLGIFIPLIVVNCIVLGRAEAFASKNTFGLAIVDGLANGLGFTLVLVILGGLRELLGQGTIFSQAHLMFGSMGQYISFTLGTWFHGALIAILPPGAFLGLGLLIAAKNAVFKY